MPVSLFAGGGVDDSHGHVGEFGQVAESLEFFDFLYLEELHIGSNATTFKRHSRSILFKNYSTTTNHIIIKPKCFIHQCFL